MTKSKKTDYKYIWSYLVELGRHDLIDLMVKSDKKKIHEIIIKKRMVPDLVVHNTIIKYLEKNGIKVIRKDLKR
jgi:DUF1009 family protein